MTKRQIPPEGTIIWVWVRESWRRMGIGPVKCRVEHHWPERHAEAHAVDSKEWMLLDEFVIFAESLEECVRMGLERETRNLEQLKSDYERRAALVAELREKWA